MSLFELFIDLLARFSLLVGIFLGLRFEKRATEAHQASQHLQSQQEAFALDNAEKANRAVTEADKKLKGAEKEAMKAKSHVKAAKDRKNELVMMHTNLTEKLHTLKSELTETENKITGLRKQDQATELQEVAKEVKLSVVNMKLRHDVEGRNAVQMEKAKLKRNITNAQRATTSPVTLGKDDVKVIKQDSDKLARFFKDVEVLHNKTRTHGGNQTEATLTDKARTIAHDLEGMSLDRSSTVEEAEQALSTVDKKTKQVLQKLSTTPEARKKATKREQKKIMKAAAKARLKVSNNPDTPDKASATMDKALKLGRQAEEIKQVLRAQRLQDYNPI